MLQTKRCVLNKLNESDFHEVKKLYVNHEVRKFLGGVVDESVLLAAGEAMLVEEGAHYWIVKDNRNGDFIGVVSITVHHDREDKEVSYQLMPDWWGEGYGTEVVQEVVRFALEELKFPRLIAETQTANQASCRLLEKIGMKREKTLIRYGAEQAIYYIVRGMERWKFDWPRKMISNS